MSLVKITYNLPKEIEEKYPNVTLATGFLDENEWPDIEDNSLFKDLTLGNYSDNEIENLVVSILKYIVYLIDERIIKPAYVPGSEILVLNHRDNDDYYLATISAYETPYPNDISDRTDVVTMLAEYQLDYLDNGEFEEVEITIPFEDNQ